MVSRIEGRILLFKVLSFFSCKGERQKYYTAKISSELISGKCEYLILQLLAYALTCTRSLMLPRAMCVLLLVNLPESIAHLIWFNQAKSVKGVSVFFGILPTSSSFFFINLNYLFYYCIYITLLFLII